MVLIRPARSIDAAGIAEVHVASWRTTYPGLLPDSYLVGLSPPLHAERWRGILAREAGARGCFVAIEPPYGVIGFASCGPQRTRIAGFGGEFYTIYLYDFAQGRGIGRRLMATMATDLISRGNNSALVWVLRENPSRWFYERLGGVRAGDQRTSFAGCLLNEIAYGWQDLTTLADLSADPSVR